MCHFRPDICSSTRTIRCSMCNSNKIIRRYLSPSIMVSTSVLYFDEMKPPCKPPNDSNRKVSRVGTVSSNCMPMMERYGSATSQCVCSSNELMDYVPWSGSGKYMLWYLGMQFKRKGKANERRANESSLRAQQRADDWRFFLR